MRPPCVDGTTALSVIAHSQATGRKIPKEILMSSTVIPVSTPVVISIPKTLLQLVALALLAVGVYYFIGVDQGMTSVFGQDAHIHEFVHDGRHFLGFPCH
jgi:hypothetical protein